MEWFAIPDWHKLFSPSAPLLEIVIRGSLIYIGLFVLLRLFRREAGSIGTADLLVVVLIADAAQNALAGEYKSIPDGLIVFNHPSSSELSPIFAEAIIIHGRGGSPYRPPGCLFATGSSTAATCVAS